MHALQKIPWRLYSTPLSQRLILTGLVLATVGWLCLQKGCVLNPDISPAHAIADTGAVAIRSVMGGQAPETTASARSFQNRKERRPPRMDQGAPSRPLQQASSLLRQAAARLDQNDRRALRLILQAITILKHEIMRGTDGPEYDRISSAPFPSEQQESWQETQALVSLLRQELVRYESGLQLDRQPATGLLPLDNAGRSTNR